MDILIAGDLAHISGRARPVRVADVYWCSSTQIEITTTEGIVIYTPVELVHRLPEHLDTAAVQAARAPADLWLVPGRADCRPRRSTDRRGGSAWSGRCHPGPVVAVH